MHVCDHVGDDGNEDDEYVGVTIIDCDESTVSRFKDFIGK